MTMIRDVRRWLGDPVHVLVLGGVGVLAALVVLYVQVNVVNVPFFDEWHTSAEIAVDTARGELNLADFFGQWNEHRPMLLYFIVMLNTWLTDWNVAVQSYAHVVVGLVLVIVAARLATSHIDLPARRRTVLLCILIPIAVLVLALRMRQIWLWGMQIIWTLGFIFFLGGLLTLRRSPVGWRGVIAAVLGAAGFTYTLAYGLLSWGIYPVVMWVMGYRDWRHYALYFAGMALVVGQFLIGYNTGEVGVNIEVGRGVGLATNPINVVYFATMMLGSPLVPFSRHFANFATLMGALGIVFFAFNALWVWRRDRSLKNVIIPAALAGFAIASGLIIGLGRAQDFPDPFIHYPLVDRYTQPASMLWLAVLIVVMLNVYHAVQRGRLRWLPRLTLVGGMFALGCVINANRMTPISNPWVLPAGEECVRNFPVDRDFGCLFGLFIPYPDFDYLERLPTMNDLSALRLTTWSDPAIPVPYSDVLELHNLPFTIVRQDGEAPNFAYRTIINQWRGPMLAMDATAQIEFALTLPDTPAPLTFKSAAYLNLQGLPVQGPFDGVIYRVAVITTDGSLTRLYEQLYDPNTTREIVAITADLSAYRGQAVTLIIQVGGREIATDNRALWLDPRIETGVLAP